MIVEAKWTERPGGMGAPPVTTRKIRFASQQEEGLFLRNMITTYRHLRTIRRWAVDVVFRWARCEPKRKLSHAIAIARWVQQHIRYVNEGDEEFSTPIRTLRDGFGDCDDFTTLVGAGVEALGIPTQIVLMWLAQKPGPFAGALEKMGMPWELTRTGTFKHIFPRALIEHRGRVLRVALDATLNAPAGTANPIRIAAARGDKVKALVL